MVLLALFAVAAGIGTALSPCSLPILPALLSAGAVGGRRRPLGIVLGLAATFTLTVVGVAEVVDGVGLGDSALRDVAIGALLLFGVAIAFPAVGDRLEAPLSRLARFGPKGRGDGFASGLGVGAALGFVYAPCAGPILAAVIAVSAASGETILLGLAYALGSAAALLAIALLGRTILARLPTGPHLQQALGGIMIATAVAMSLSLDVDFQQSIARHLPAALVDPTNSLETSHAVQRRLADLDGRPKFVAKATPTPTKTAASRPETASSKAPTIPSSLPVLGSAPEFTGTQRWFNGPPETIAGNVAAHKVTLVDFWTYTCINCLRTLPYDEAWDARYRGKGLDIVGVHSPEFSFEKNAGNVQQAIRRLGVKYPVVQDNDLKTWSAWGNQYWPALYLVDAKGKVRYVHFGEGDDARTEAAIRSLLAEADGGDLGADAKPKDVVTPSDVATPETYIGTARAQGWAQAPRKGVHDYAAPRSLRPNEFALSGRWDIGDQQATAQRGAGLQVAFHARDVYLVLSPPRSGTGSVQVTLDGRPRKRITVDAQRLYKLAELPRASSHRLGLRFGAGTSGYAFTFG